MRNFDININRLSSTATINNLSQQQQQILTSEETRRLTGMVAKTRALFESKENIDKTSLPNSIKYYSQTSVSSTPSPRVVKVNDDSIKTTQLGLNRKFSNKENVVTKNEFVQLIRNKQQEKEQTQQKQEMTNQKENPLFQPFICKLKKIQNNNLQNTNNVLSVVNQNETTKQDNEYNLPTSVKQAKKCFESLAAQSSTTASTQSQSPDFNKFKLSSKLLNNKNDESSSASSVSSLSSYSSYETKSTTQRFIKPILTNFDTQTKQSTTTKPSIHRIIKLDNCVSQIAKDIITDYKQEELKVQQIKVESKPERPLIQNTQRSLNKVVIKEEDTNNENYDKFNMYQSRFAFNKSNGVQNGSCVLPSNVRNRSQSLIDPKQVNQVQNNSSVAKRVVRSASSAREALLRWCKYMTQNYSNIRIENFSSSWSNGLAFCALIHNFMPSAFDYSKLSATNCRYNFELAFKVAESAGIVSLLDVDDMIEMGNSPDWKCVFTYVHSIYQRFKDDSSMKR